MIVGRSPTTHRSSRNHVRHPDPENPQIGKLTFVVQTDDDDPELYSCGLGVGEPVSTLRPGQALAGIVTTCNADPNGDSSGTSNPLTIVATSATTPSNSPPFVAGVTPTPAYCSPYGTIVA